MYKISNDGTDYAYYVGSRCGAVFGAGEVALLVKGENVHSVYHREAGYPGVCGNTLCGGVSFIEKNRYQEFKAKNIQTFRIDQK